MGYMINHEIPEPISNPNGLLLALRRKLPQILLAGGFLVFSSGCVLNPHVNDILVADRNVTVGSCTVKAGQQIVLESLDVVQQGAGQYQDVFGVSGPCPGKLPSDIVMTGFSRP